MKIKRAYLSTDNSVPFGPSNGTTLIPDAAKGWKVELDLEHRILVCESPRGALVIPLERVKFIELEPEPVPKK